MIRIIHASLCLALWLFGHANAALAVPVPLTQSVELCFEFANAFLANGGDFPLAEYGRL